MIQKKVCMIGASGVGKTSLVSRFVHSMFSERYLTTVGVKIDKKEISLDETVVKLIIWDLAGVDEFHEQLTSSHLRGAGGFLIVADGTRAATLDCALDVRRGAADAIGAVPVVLAINKLDLESQWEVGHDRADGLVSRGWGVVRTSAKTGEGVEAAFTNLARRMLS
jgi:small GTP-binding protein